MNKTKSDEPVSRPVTTSDVLAFLVKPKHWLGAIIRATTTDLSCRKACLIPEYSLVYSIPIIVQNLGYNSVVTASR
ncbi:hypothetical protein PG991_003043 [Apiospora marii]|uniref:Uncharacterized protein n=1 Tax=Apiospora marii TaxID=335849 RepID=A0ABR1SH28_9PEZI